MTRRGEQTIRLRYLAMHLQEAASLRHILTFFPTLQPAQG